MLENPGKPVDIYRIAEIIGKAYGKAFTHDNIQNGFRVTGIHPYDSVFADYETPSTSRQVSSDTYANHEVSSTPHSVQSRHSTPEMIRPYPKAEKRKKTGGRKAGKTRILTDTPEKEEIENRKSKRIKTTITKPRVQRRLIVEVEISESDAEETVLSDSSSEDMETFLSNLKATEEDEILEEQFVSSDVSVDDFVLVQLPGKKDIFYYVAKVVKVLSDEFEVVYYKRFKDTYKFVIDTTPTVYIIPSKEIVRKLPPPFTNGVSLRQKSQLSFGVDFTLYNIK
jgi:hypothetical protein